MLKNALLHRVWLVDPIALLILLSMALMLSWLLYQPLRSAAFTMDTLPTMLPRDGMHEREMFSDDTGVFRWTRGHAEIKLPNPGGMMVAALRLSGGPRQTVPVTLSTRDVSWHFVLTPGVRTYTVLLPAAARERITLSIMSSTIEERNRTLGVVVSDIRLSGGGGVPAQAALVLAWATGGVYLLLRRARLSIGMAAGIVLAAQVTVLLWQTTAGWRYGLFSPLLGLVGLASLMAVGLERWLPPATPTQPATVKLSRRDGWIIVALIATALIARLPWLDAPDPVGDMELAARRMWFLHESGLAGSYLYGGDYVPFRLYILWASSYLVEVLGGSFFYPLPDVTLALIKLPGLLADLATVAIIYIWSRRWCQRRPAALIAALYTLSPPVWMNVAWWGQVDTLLMLPLLGMVMLLERASGRWSWLCWSAAMLIKPQAIIFAPLLYMATLRLHGSRGIMHGGAIAASLFALACVPLALAQQGPGLLEAYVGSVGRFPRLTIGAYNLWYLVTGGAGRADDVLLLGPLTYRMLGLLFMLTAALLVGIVMLRRADSATRALGAAVLALAFFLLPTQIHERYLFLTLPFLALCIAFDQRMVVPYSILVLTATINILGDLDGFIPIITPIIQASPLPFISTILNLGVFSFLLYRLLKPV